MKNIFILLYFFFTAFSGATAADSCSHKKVYIIPIPILYYVPETRLAFGAGASFTFKLNKDSATNYSEFLGVAAYTQNHQIVLYSPFELYTKNNNYYFEGDVGFYKYSYYYWGTGTDRVNKELYEVIYPRITLNTYRRLFSKFYAGFDYNLQRNHIIKTDPQGTLTTGSITGSTGYVASGIGLDLLYDSRDSIFFPTKGLFIRIATFDYSSLFGSTALFKKITTDFSWYKKITPTVILAINQRNQFTYGNAPFDQLALIGGSRQMRGYYYGYYRDKFMTLLQAEARIHLYGVWGLAVFGASALIGHPGVFPESPGLILAEGAGLRYNANKRQHINVRGDIGYGRSLEYYLSVEEAF